MGISRSELLGKNNIWIRDLRDNQSSPIPPPQHDSKSDHGPRESEGEEQEEVLENEFMKQFRLVIDFFTNGAAA